MTTTETAGLPEHHHHPLVDIQVNYRRVEVAEEISGAGIKAAAHINATFDLYKINGEDETFIADDLVLKVRDGEEFVATPCLEPA